MSNMGYWAGSFRSRPLHKSHANQTLLVAAWLETPQTPDAAEVNADTSAFHQGDDIFHQPGTVTSRSNG
jgi:hypothetical protein